MKLIYKGQEHSLANERELIDFKVKEVGRIIGLLKELIKDAKIREQIIELFEHTRASYRRLDHAPAELKLRLAETIFYESCGRNAAGLTERQIIKNLVRDRRILDMDVSIEVRRAMGKKGLEEEG